MTTAKVGDVELYYEQHGEGEPLVLIMGLAADSQAWLFQVPEFSKRYRTVTFDNRGVGRSSKPPGPYSIAGMADDTARLMDALDIPRAHVVGVSMGGMIAQELALRHSERVKGLVLGCTFAAIDGEITETRDASITQLGGAIGADGSLQIDAASIDPMMFMQQLLPRVFNPDYLQRELPTLIQLFSGALQWGFSMEAILAQAEAAMGHDCTTRLGDISSPTLVITGDSDLLIPPRSSEKIASKIPGARLVKIPGGSHGFNFETPDVFNRHVLDFLGSLN
jgi:pimeloyl-ACP methyl ester carboxylesterase